MKNSFVFLHAFDDLDVIEAVGSVDDRLNFQEFVFVFVSVFDADFDLMLKDGLDGSCHFLFEEEGDDMSISEYSAVMNCDFIISRG